MGYMDYDYSFLIKDYKGENGPNWQRDAKIQVDFIMRLLKERTIIYDITTELFIWSTSRKPIYPELIPLVQTALRNTSGNELFGDKEFVKSQYTQSFQVSMRHKDEFQTTFLRDLFSEQVFWRRNGSKKVFDMVKSYVTAELYIEGGVARWATNHSIIPRDCYEPLAYSNILSKVYLSKNNDARKLETDRMTAEYRKKQKGYKSRREELAEMENAFGKGTKVVDTITRKRVL